MHETSNTEHLRVLFTSSHFVEALVTCSARHERVVCPRHRSDHNDSECGTMQLNIARHISRYETQDDGCTRACYHTCCSVASGLDVVQAHVDSTTSGLLHNTAAVFAALKR